MHLNLQRTHLRVDRRAQYGWAHGLCNPLRLLFRIVRIIASEHPRRALPRSQQGRHAHRHELRLLWHWRARRLTRRRGPSQPPDRPLRSHADLLRCRHVRCLRDAPHGTRGKFWRRDHGEDLVVSGRSSRCWSCHALTLACQVFLSVAPSSRNGQVNQKHALKPRDVICT